MTTRPFTESGNEVSDDDTRTRILAAAGPAFAEKGFRDTTVREICSAAEVNVASVNYHFGDKERLYIESVKSAHAQKMRRAEMPTWDSGTPASRKLQDFVLAFVERVTSHEADDWQHQLLMREMAAPSQACREMVEDSIRPEFQLLRGILCDLLPADVPMSDDRLYQIIFSVIGQCLFYHVGGHVARMLVPAESWQQTFSSRRIADHITQFTLAALGVATSNNGDP